MSYNKPPHKFDSQAGQYYSRERVVQKEQPRRRKEGHDALIEMVAHRGAVIILTLVSGDIVSGVLKESDRFTVSLFVLRGQPIDPAWLTAGKGWDDLIGDQQPSVFYKHAIESFRLVVKPSSNV